VNHYTSLLKRINNKIKVIKRIAYRYRDADSFFLKVRMAFPGNFGRTFFLRSPFFFPSFRGFL